MPAPPARGCEFFVGSGHPRCWVLRAWCLAREVRALLDCCALAAHVSPPVVEMMRRSMRIVRTLAIPLLIWPLILSAGGSPLCAPDQAHASSHDAAHRTAASAHTEGGHHDNSAPASHSGHSDDHFGHEHPGSSESIPGPEDHPCSCSPADVSAAWAEPLRTREVQGAILLAHTTDQPVLPRQSGVSERALSTDCLNSPYLRANPPLLI